MIFCISSHYSLSGGADNNENALNTILSFNKTEESWQPAGQMSVRRAEHAVEKIEDIGQHCP